MPRSPRKTPIKKRPLTKKKTHPTYKDMITEAILEDKQWTKGSSRQTIAKYIISNYGIDEAMVRQRLGNTIRRLTEEDEGPVLIKNVGCYKLDPDWKKDYLKKKTKKKSSTSSTSTPRKKRKKSVKKRSYKKKKDKNAPKKGQSAYIIYSSSIRNSIKNKYPDATFGDISRKIAAKWKKLPNSKREKFFTLSEADKKRYEREMKSYKKRKRDSSSTSGSTSSSTTSSSSSSSSSSEEPSSSSESSEEKKRKKRKSISEKSEKEKSEKSEKEKAEKEKAEKEKGKEKSKTDLRKLEKKKSSSTSD